ncbi:hypothetical protein [Aminobacter sp. MSH1]|uniref:hypothetical protein n=1 Tax=Aminobacter sp. MSH1 TaxID=374606 RepID=UPI000D3CD685|nr:hypothetical protein [Aminobacter sp. MSH1]
MTSMTRSTHFEFTGTTTLTDPALALSQAWTQAHAAMAEQCLKQQQLETELLESRRSPANVDGRPASRAGRHHGMRRAYAEAKAAEALASAHEQELPECLARTPANSLAGVVAKLSVIVTEAEDNTDLTDFPVSHVRSALEDLRRLMDQGIVDPCPLPNDGSQDVSRPGLCRTRRQGIQRER